MDGECINCGESGNWCRCDEERETSEDCGAASAAAVLLLCLGACGLCA